MAFIVLAIFQDLAAILLKIQAVQKVMSWVTLGVFKPLPFFKAHSNTQSHSVTSLFHLLPIKIDSLRAERSGDRIPVGGEIFRAFPDRPWNPPSLL